MGYGGIPMYFGPDAASRRTASSARSLERAVGTTAQHKRIDNPRDMFDMLNMRERAVLEAMKRARPERRRATRARLAAAREWRAEFFSNENPVFQQMYSGRRAVGTEPAARGVPHRADVALVRQLGCSCRATGR